MEILKVTDGNKLFKYTPRYNIINLQKQLFDATKSAQYYFYGCGLESVDDLIIYSDTENIIDMSRMFGGCEKLQTIPLLDTSNVINMEAMFGGCINLQTIPQLNTSNVTYMNSMFSDCKNLQTIPQLDTSNVTDMFGMFNNCTNLRTISRLDTSNVTNMGNMFNYCTNLQIIDLTSLDKISSTSNISYFASGCYFLIKLIIRNMTAIPPLNTNSFTNCYHFTGTVDSNYNPEGLKDGRIYVPDDYVEQLKQATNWSVYADIIVPLSTLEE